MNKIIITGHPESGYGAVETLLMRCGMRSALPSRREGLLPKDIHQTLRKAHHIDESYSITEERGFLPVFIGPVWHGVAMDLLLGNLGQEPWGWADPDTLFFLDYWRTLDPDSVFVLVYDSPASALRESGFDSSVNDVEAAIRARLDNWAAYNGAMLRFYFQHMDRCVLVHARQLQGDSQYCLKEIQAKLSAPLPTPDATEDLPLENDHLTADVGTHAVAAVDSHAITSTQPPQADHPTSRFLIEFQLDRQPQHRALYDELQAAANLPLQREENAWSYGTTAWISWLQERKNTTRKVDQLTRRCQDLETNLNRLQQDHELTFLQHAQACEELEHMLLENRSLHFELEHLKLHPSQPETAPVPPPLTGAAERVKSQLSYRLGSLMVAKAKTPLGIITLPFSLAGEALSFRGEKNARKEKLPPLNEYADAAQAVKVKKQLSYRLGNTLVRRSSSPLGWLILPFALIRQIQTFHRSRTSDA